MKRTIFLLTAVFALLAVSCKKEDSVLVLSEFSFIFPDETAGSAEAKVICNTGWKATFSSDWLSVSPKSGNGDTVVRINVKENSGTGKRSGNVVFSTDDGAAVRIMTVTQPGKKASEEENPIDNIVIAHRGACKEFGFPDNSQAGLRKAIELNLYGSECDINISSDDVVVVTHGTSFGGRAIKDTPYLTLKASGKLSNGETLPTLEEYINTAMAGSGTKLFVDVKSLSDEAGGNSQSIKAGVAAAKLVKRLHAEDYVCFIIGRAAVYNGVKPEVGDAWPVAYMNYDAAKSTFKKMGCTWGNFDISAYAKGSDGKFDASIAESKLKEWNDAGVELSFYNIDTEAQIQWWLPHRNEVKACTNYPNALMRRIGLR